MDNEQQQLFEDMAASLKGIAKALEELNKKIDSVMIDPSNYQSGKSIRFAGVIRSE